MQLWALGLLLELIIAKLVQLLLLSLLLVVLCSSPTPDVLQQIPCYGQQCEGGTAMLRPIRGLKRDLTQRKGNPALPQTLSVCEPYLINLGGGCSQCCCASKEARNCLHGLCLPLDSLTCPADREGSGGIAHPDLSLRLQGWCCTAPGPFPELAEPPQNSLKALLQQMQVPQRLQPPALGGLCEELQAGGGSGAALAGSSCG